MDTGVACWEFLAEQEAFSRLGADYRVEVDPQTKKTHHVFFMPERTEDKDLKKLPDVPFEFVLSLFGSQVTDTGLKELKELKNLAKLHLGQRLYDGKPSLTDETMAVLTELKALETLQLDEARLSGAALTKLKGLPKLKRLTLHVIDIPEADVEKLRAELAGVEVKWDKPDEKGMKYIGRFFDPK